MIEIRGNLFDQKADVLCITTNGFVKSDGRSVMGRGCALEASRRWPDLPAVLGQMIRAHGNHVHWLAPGHPGLVSFPVKPVSVVYDGRNAVRHMVSKFKIGDTVPGWAAIADPAVIEQSARELAALATKTDWKKVVLPRPGCGAGELKWENVRNILSPILDDRFAVITF